MAQTEDTELRDLVIEALEKNGSLAKIRALLRANIFLAFEDDCDNVKQNSSLENVLRLPEGILSLSIVHEFLEFCNLKNTLFVYMSESRQNTGYNFQSKKTLIDKLNLKKEASKEPVLLTLIKLCSQKKLLEQNKKGNIKKNADNCTYTVEDLQSSATSNTQSDTSSDEKNKLHLRLQLDNSDTDTSNESARDKVTSEYFPSEHFKNYKTDNKIQHSSEVINDKKNIQTYNTDLDKSTVYENIKGFKIANNSSDSTSYMELKPFNSLDEKLLNTAGVPTNEVKTLQSVSNNSIKTTTLSSNSASLKDDSLNKSSHEDSINKSLQEIEKSDIDTAEYSFNFSSSPSRKGIDVKNNKILENLKDFDYQHVNKDIVNKDSLIECQQQSSQSSVSISDVADLISEKSLSIGNQTNKSMDKSRLSSHSYSRRKSDNYKSKFSDDSGDFSESPIASLSNLSLDIHSD